MTYFLVIDQVFVIFPFFFQIFRIFTVLNVVYDPFFIRKKHYFRKKLLDNTLFTLFVLSRASDNTLLLKILVEDGCMGRPPTSTFFFGPPSSPLSLCP